MSTTVKLEEGYGRNAPYDNTVIKTRGSDEHIPRCQQRGRCREDQAP